ncbi:MAG: MarR family transcriptional regulator [Pseudonocardiaceae bacterium]|nr:MarR family transcriptional regulator [Pseudonocardiaceae bacterium]
MRAWRAYAVGSALLEYRLHRDLQEAHGITLADYELLVRLSEAPEGRIRMSSLAELVASSKSRVSHQVARMGKADLVVREGCPSDGRGVFAVLTDHGWDVLRTAAPTHVEGVRAHLVDGLSAEERTILARVFERVSEQLRGESW